MDGGPIQVANKPCCACAFGAVDAAIAAALIFGAVAFVLASPEIIAFFALEGALSAAGVNLFGFSAVVSGGIAGLIENAIAKGHC
jgi:hypothetical protein